MQLTLAEALIAQQGRHAKDKDDAEQLLEAIKDKVPPSEVSRVAALSIRSCPRSSACRARGARKVPSRRSQPPQRSAGDDERCALLAAWSCSLACVAAMQREAS